MNHLPPEPPPTTSDVTASNPPMSRSSADTSSELSERAPSDRESSGRLTLIRAALIAATGGGIVALISMVLGPRFFVADVRLVGMLVGLGIVALSAVGPIDPTTRKTTTGALIIVAAVVAFPIAAGGYFIGSILAVLGGAMFVAYEPPTGDVVVRLHRAGRIRRGLALLIDFVLVFIAQRLLYLAVPTLFTTTANVVVAWAFCWVIVAVVPVIWTRRTAGRLLLTLRIASMRDGERPSAALAAAREALRGAFAIASFVVLAQIVLRNQFKLLPTLLALVLVVGAAAIIEALQLFDRATRTADAVELVEAVDPAAESGGFSDGSDPDGSAVDAPADSDDDLTLDVFRAPEPSSRIA